MRLAIIGGGAMGTLLAGLLGPHAEVWVLSTHPDTVEALRRDGARIRTGDGPLAARVNATLEPGDASPSDVALICVKSYETDRAGRAAARALAPGGLAISLQNGLGNGEVLARFLDLDRVVQGVTYLGATWLGPGEVREAGRGATILETGSSPDLIEEVAGLFSAAGLECRVTDDSEGLVWGKLLVNSAINPLTALLRVRNGVLVESEPAVQLLHQAVDEAVAIAAAADVRLPYDDPRAQVEMVCRKTGSNVSSMLQVVIEKGPTEIEAINGALVQEADRRGLSAPLHEALRDMVRALEATYADQVAPP